MHIKSLRIIIIIHPATSPWCSVSVSLTSVNSNAAFLVISSNNIETKNVTFLDQILVGPNAMWPTLPKFWVGHGPPGPPSSVPHEVILYLPWIFWKWKWKKIFIQRQKVQSVKKIKNKQAINRATKTTKTTATIPNLPRYWHKMFIYFRVQSISRLREVNI